VVSATDAVTIVKGSRPFSEAQHTGRGGEETAMVEMFKVSATPPVPAKKMTSCPRGHAGTKGRVWPVRGPPMVAARPPSAEMVIQDNEWKKNDEQAAPLDGGVATGED